MSEAVWAGAFGGKGFVLAALTALGGGVYGVIMEYIWVLFIAFALWVLFSLIFMLRVVQQFARIDRHINEIDRRLSEVNDALYKYTDTKLDTALDEYEGQHQ